MSPSRLRTTCRKSADRVFTVRIQVSTRASDSSDVGDACAVTMDAPSSAMASRRRITLDSIRSWRRGRQHFTAAVRLQRAYEPRRFHRLDHARRAVVPDLEPPLHAGDRGLPALGDDAHGFVVERVLLRIASTLLAFPAGLAGQSGDRGRRTLEDFLDVARWTGGLEPADDAMHFRIGHEGAVYAHRQRRAGLQEKHVAVAEQRFRAALVEDRAGIDLGGHLE